MAVYNLPWANQSVLNATGKLQRRQGPLVPDVAPDFPFQLPFGLEPDPMGGGQRPEEAPVLFGGGVESSLIPQPWTPGAEPTAPYQTTTGVPTPTPMATAANERRRLIMPPGMSPHFDQTQPLTPPVIPVMQEFAQQRYQRDWEQTREALERSDSRVSGFQTFLDTITWTAPGPSTFEILDVTAAIGGGGFVDAWNNVKAAVGGDFGPITDWSVPRSEEPMDIYASISPDFTKEDLGRANYFSRFSNRFGTEIDRAKETVRRQQERPWYVRLPSEVLTPLEVASAATLARTGMNLVRVTPVLAAPPVRGALGLFRRTGQAIVKTVATVADYPSWMWDDPYSWEPAFRQQGGIVIPNTMGQAQLEEFGVLLNQDANIYAGPLADLKKVIGSIATKGTRIDNLIFRTALKLSNINPSLDLASISPAGLHLVAMNMQKLAAEELINTALLSGYDRHGAVGGARLYGGGRATPILGRLADVEVLGKYPLRPFLGGGSPLQKISQEGFYGDTGDLWQEVFANSRRGRYHLSANELRMIDDYNSITNIEIPRMLDEAGITTTMRNDPNSVWYVPRNVVDIKGLMDDLRVDYTRIQNNPDLARHYEDIMDGYVHGVRYDIDPRRTLELHMRWAYRKIIKKQFMDALEEEGISHTAKELLGQVRTDRYRAALDYVRTVGIKRRRIASGIRTALKHEAVAEATTNERELALQITVQDIDMLDQLILTTTFPDLDAPRAWAKATGSSVRLQEGVVRSLERASARADKQLQLSLGKEKGYQSGMEALQRLYNDLEDVLDNLAPTPHLSDDEVRTALKGPRRFAEAVRSGISITKVQVSERKLGQYFQVKYGLRKIDPKLATASRRFLNEGNAIEELTSLRESVEDALDLARADLVVAKKNLNVPENLVRLNQRTKNFRKGQQSERNKQLKRLQNRSGANRGKVRRASERLEDVRGRRQMLEGIRDALDAQLTEGDAELRMARTGPVTAEGRPVLADDGLPIGYQTAKKYFKDRATAHADGALWGKNQGDKITIGQWRNRWFTHSDVTLIEEYFKKNQVDLISTTVAGKLAILANSIRFLSAIGDFAMPFIQGQMVLATNPEAWAKMTLRHYQAWFDPTVQAKLVSENLVDYQAMARLGIPIGDPEFFSALQTGQGLSPGALLEFLPKGTEFRNLMRGGGKQTFGRFQASYNAGLGHARLLLYQGAKESWSGTDAQLAQYVRNLTGGLDSRALGVGPGARQAENLWLAFSPRLLRSTIALVSDGLLRPNTPQGKRSLRTLGTWLAGAHGVYVLSGLAMGKDWDEIEQGLNPLNGKRYLAHLINDDWVGFGGQGRAITQLMYGMTMGEYQDETSLTSLSLQDNPILSFISGRAPVGLSIVGGAVEAGTGGKINALPYERVDGLPDYLLHVTTSALPFVIQGRLEGEGWTATGSAAGGMRTSAETPFDRRRVERLAEADRRGMDLGNYLTNDEWMGLGADTRRDIDKAVYGRNPTMESDIEKVEADWGNDTWYYKNEVKIIEDETMMQFNRLWDDEYSEGQYPWGFKFRTEVNRIRGEKAVLLKALRDSASPFLLKETASGERVRMVNPEYDKRIEAALDYFEEKEKPEHEFDMALAEYIEGMYGEDSPDEKELLSLRLIETDPSELLAISLAFDFDERDRREKLLQKQLGPSMFERVETYLRDGDPESVKALDADRKILSDSGYWRVNERVKQGKSDYVQRAWDEYMNESNPPTRKAIKAKYDHPAAKSGNIITDMENERDDMRLAIRALNPEVTAILIRHGYGIGAPREWEGPIPWLEYQRTAPGATSEEWKRAYQWLDEPTGTPTP